MGIGRFAFTPLLPMKLHDGVVDIALEVPVWETEFWNHSFVGVLTLANADEPAPFFQEHASLDWRSGALSAATGSKPSSTRSIMTRN